MNASNIEIVAYEESPLGPLCLRRRELLSEPGTVVTEITLNHEFLMSSYHTESERVLAEGGLSFHAQRNPGGDSGIEPADSSADSPGLRVLVGGLGLGYTAFAVLESDLVGHVDVVELLPQVIDWMRDGLVPLSAELNTDPRFRPIQGDVYGLLDRDPEAPASGKPGLSGKYDLILIDVDHSPDESLGSESERFYRAEGLARVRAHLAEGGVLGVWSYDENTWFSRVLGEVFDEVQVVPVRFRNRMVECDEENWLFFAG